MGKGKILFYVLNQYYPVYDCYMKELCTMIVKAGKVQFLKNWNEKGKRRVQNTGKGVVNKLHNIAFKILKKIRIITQATPGVGLQLRI